MPRTINGLYYNIISYDSLLNAFRKMCSNGKSEKIDTLIFKNNLEENLVDLHNSLIWKTWIPDPFHTYYIYDPKKRLIEVPSIRDRVLHQAICTVINPIFDKKFINCTFACRVGYGTHACSEYVTNLIKDAHAHSNGRKIYFLKGDISAYYQSISHDILMKLIKRVISDKDLIWLLEKIIYNSGYTENGIPKGSQTSQLFGNIYLNALDQYIKSDLRMKYYARYMDDTIIIDYDKKHLHDLKIHLGEWLLEKLHLRWNPKTTISPISHGIDFCGYRHWHTHSLPRKRIVKRMRKRCKRITDLYPDGKITIEQVRSVVSSFCGYMRYCKGYRTTRSTLRYLVLRKGK